MEDDVAIMQLNEETYSFNLVLEFWINNNRLTPIEVGFEVGDLKMLNSVLMTQGR